jgi:hypothetical protein
MPATVLRAKSPANRPESLWKLLGKDDPGLELTWTANDTPTSSMSCEPPGMMSPLASSPKPETPGPGTTPPDLFLAPNSYRADTSTFAVDTSDVTSDAPRTIDPSMIIKVEAVNISCPASPLPMQIPANNNQIEKKKSDPQTRMEEAPGIIKPGTFAWFYTSYAPARFHVFMTRQEVSLGYFNCIVAFCPFSSSPLPLLQLHVLNLFNALKCRKTGCSPEVHRKKKPVRLSS